MRKMALDVADWSGSPSSHLRVINFPFISRAIRVYCFGGCRGVRWLMEVDAGRRSALEQK
jgi:hypothetical protein